ncbi:MAG: FecR domain-containing protein [Fuerstiella sp.]|nr:FecR domain-containing protein [Fuerstiella sp.]MCP4859169.1 FecR domain-containing protein [Fuerstiella sp.]
MTPGIDELISGYLDGVLTDEQQAELSKWIEADPENADQFADAILLDNRLHAEVIAAQHKDRNDISRVSIGQRWDDRVSIRVVIALAACLLLAIGISFWTSDNDKQELSNKGGIAATDAPFATVAHVVAAEWANDEEISIGDRLSDQTIRLRSGFVRVVFDNGVEVTLQGPAEYELTAAGKTKLNSGLLTATVPPGAEGFTVDTPTGEVVDLGTSFGIELQEDGVSRVSVFEGEVEVALPDSTEKQLLKEGEAVRVEAGQRIETVAFDPKPFTKIWPISSGIDRSTNGFRFVPPWPPQMRFVRSDKDIFVAPEGHATTLTSSLRVNASSPGEYSQRESLSASEIAVGQRIRSFILLFHPKKAGPRITKPVAGSITFDSPVLGLMVLHEELQASARRFARWGPQNVREKQQLELNGEGGADLITLSEDRRTVTLRLTAGARSGELIRVIVDASKQSTSKSASNGND